MGIVPDVLGTSDRAELKERRRRQSVAGCCVFLAQTTEEIPG